MGKKSLIFAFFVLGFEPSQAQILTKKYSIGVYLGICYNKGVKGPKTPTDVSPVKFTIPYAKTFGFSFDYKFPKQYIVGFEGFYDEFELGYRAKRSVNLGGVGVVSGIELANGRISLYKAGIRVGKKFKIFKGLSINTILVPSFAFSLWNNDLVDTALANSNQRDESHAVGSPKPYNEILYFRYPAYQNTGFHFVVKSIVEIQYTFNNKFGLSVGAAYQQGFRPSVIDTVNIVRQYEPNMPQQKYWTRISGTSIQYHFGLRYDF